MKSLSLLSRRTRITLLALATLILSFAAAMIGWAVTPPKQGMWHDISGRAPDPAAKLLVDPRVYRTARLDEAALVDISDTNFTIPSGGTSPTPTPTPFSGFPVQFGNISTRLRVELGDNALIGGFIVTGTQPKRVIVRAIGPSLTPFGVVGAIPDPVLELRNSSGALIAFNDDWQTDQQAEIIGTGLPPSHIRESAIVTTLPANNSAYTAIVRGYNNATGIGVVEAYDLDRATNSKLANISTRGFVNTGDNVMIGGLIIVGNTTANVMIRAIGPSLAAFGVPNALLDPTLGLYDGNGTLLAFNDDWQTDQQAAIIATGLAPTHIRESAIVRTLSPGAYTAIVRGYQNSTGVAVVEGYQLP